VPCTITPEQRQLGIQRSIEARKRYAQERKAIAKQAGSILLQSTPQVEQQLPDARAQEILSLIQRKIAEADKALEADMPAKDRAQLIGALERLLERERVWSQRPGPGNLKPTSQRQRSGPPTPTV